jgi:hypothetical protein
MYAPRRPPKTPALGGYDSFARHAVSIGALLLTLVTVLGSSGDEGATEALSTCPDDAGTSEASPEFAGIIALADQVAGHRVGWINPTLYELTDEDHNGGIVDITIGNNSLTFPASRTPVTVTGFNATPGYDLASGWGTVDAARFFRALAEEGS